MKKGRPGLGGPRPVRSGPGRRDSRACSGTDGIARASGSTAGERWPAARSLDSVWIDGQLIRVKVSAGRVKAEHEDVARAARRTGQSLREMAFRAEALWRTEHGRPGMTRSGRHADGRHCRIQGHPVATRPAVGHASVVRTATTGED